MSHGQEEPYQFSSYQRHYSIASNEEENESVGIFPRIAGNVRNFVANLPFDVVLALSIAVLVISMAVERVTFKVMVDRMLPYKFVLVDIIFLASCGLFSLISTYKKLCTDEITDNMKNFPHQSIALIALVDSIQFLWSVYSAIGVSPTMTVILLHASTIFIFLTSKRVFPSRTYGRLHSFGVILISVAIFLGLFKIVYNDYYFSDRFGTTESSCLYLVASALHGLSTLMKEKALVEWSQPIDVYYLSSWLFFYQFVITVAFSAVFYISEDLLGIRRSMWHSFYYGWNCFLGYTPEETHRDDDSTRYLTCAGSMYLIIAYVLATFAVLASINFVLQYSSLVVSRAVSAAILVAFLVLWMYDLHESRAHPTNYILGGEVGLFDVFALVILLVGMEIYSHDPEPDVELLTQYTPTSGLDAREIQMNELVKLQQPQQQLGEYQPLNQRSTAALPMPIQGTTSTMRSSVMSDKIEEGDEDEEEMSSSIEEEKTKPRFTPIRRA